MSDVVGKLDAIRDRVATGWVADLSSSTERLHVTFTIDDKPVGATTTGVYRPELESRGLPTASGFKCRLAINHLRDAGRVVTAHVTSHDGRVIGSLPIPPDASAQTWLRRSMSASSAAPARQPLGDIAVILMAKADDDRDVVAGAVASVARQSDPAWTLFVVGPGSLPMERADDHRIHRIPYSADFQQSLKSALTRAQAGHAILMRAFVRLEPDAVASFRRAAIGGADILYADETLTGASPDDIDRFHLKPAFSHDRHVAAPLFTSIFGVNVTTALDVWCFKRDVRCRTLPEFGLLLLEVSARVAHIPSVLSSQPLEAASRINEPAVIEDHLRRIGWPSRVKGSDRPGLALIAPEDPGGKTLIVVLTKNHGALLRSCIQSVRRTTGADEAGFVIVDHESDDPATLAYLDELSGTEHVLRYAGPFNFARMNNLAVRAARRAEHAFVLFMNNDIEAIRGGWLKGMRALAARRDVGIVGATLLYGNGLIQHTGVIMGLYGMADHAYKHFIHPDPHDVDPLAEHSVAVTKDYLAVTGACMMLRADVFVGVGGFDEALPVDYNDVDLSLRVGSLGLRNLVAGDCILNHHESATRSGNAHASLPGAAALLRRRWGRLIADGDPFYHPKMSLHDERALTRLEGWDEVRERRLWPEILPFRRAQPMVIDASIEASRLPGETV